MTRECEVRERPLLKRWMERAFGSQRKKTSGEVKQAPLPPPRMSHSLESLIALQKVLENGIPEERAGSKFVADIIPEL